MLRGSMGSWGAHSSLGTRSIIDAFVASLRNTATSKPPLRTRLLIAGAAWLLLIAFLMIGVSTSAPPWLRALGWLLLAASNIVLGTYEVRRWNARRKRI